MQKLVLRALPRSVRRKLLPYLPGILLSAVAACLILALYLTSGPLAAASHGKLRMNTAPWDGKTSGLYALSASTDGPPVALKKYAGQVSLIVNVASQCGYTASNYKGLEKLYTKYRAKGFNVLAFPCNQFGGQEPKALQEIRQFASDTYGARFPIFEKVDVNGAHADAVFTFLKTSASSDISWNFVKFLVGRDGAVLKRYGPSFDEAELSADVEAALDAGTLA